MHSRLIRGRLIASLPTFLLLSGCAISYVDKSGFEHTVGLFHAKVKIDHQLLHVQRESIGLNLSLAEGDAGFNIGYKNSYRVFVPNNVIMYSDVDGPEHTIVEVSK